MFSQCQFDVIGVGFPGIAFRARNAFAQLHTVANILLMLALLVAALQPSPNRAARCFVAICGPSVVFSCT
jgi:hypothetical protein